MTSPDVYSSLEYRAPEANGSSAVATEMNFILTNELGKKTDVRQGRGEQAQSCSFIAIYVSCHPSRPTVVRLEGLHPRLPSTIAPSHRNDKHPDTFLSRENRQIGIRLRWSAALGSLGVASAARSFVQGRLGKRTVAARGNLDVAGVTWRIMGVNAKTVVPES